MSDRRNDKSHPQEVAGVTLLCIASSAAGKERWPQPSPDTQDPGPARGQIRVILIYAPLTTFFFSPPIAMSWRRRSGR